MRRFVCRLCIWVAIVVASQLNAQVLSTFGEAEGITSCGHQKAPKAQEMTILVSPQDLYFDQEGLFANLNGDAYPVRSLQKRGHQWLATIVDAQNYCQRGHNLCSGCNQCHTEGCWYFVKYCRLWR